MFDEPEEDSRQRSFDPKVLAKEKSDELRMHAELAAVFEGPRKFDAQLIPALDPQIVRDLQRSIARLEKSRSPESPLLPEEAMPAARDILTLCDKSELSTNDYHIYRRPGEVMIVRWLVGEQVETYYDRLQAHFNAGVEGLREDERQSKEWKQDPATLAYLKALDEIDLKMAEVYLREPIRKLKIFVLSTQSADEMNIAYIADHIMSVSAVELVGRASAPSDAASERDLAWFFKLFALRGMVDDVERMCYFTYLQKTDDTFGGDE